MDYWYHFPLSVKEILDGDVEIVAINHRVGSGTKLCGSRAPFLPPIPL
jgi:hypothetical protein